MIPPYAPPRIDRYEIKSLIGAGGMGSLYLARDTNPNTYRLVALKLLKANLDSEDLRERFGREARSLAALNHPNVVNIYDSGEYQWSPYIVMEYVRGETLAEKISRKATLSTSQKLKLICELCAGLAHAHEAGIIHRDIKPANLMVDHSGRLRLLDFGIARGDVGNTRFGAQMTQVNMRIGTPGYMSPEQIEGGEIDTRSDLFAVGVVLYELIAYREAFPGNSTRQIETLVLQSQPTALSSLVENFDPELEGIVAKALAKDPAQRYQHAADMESAIEHVRWRLGLAENTPSGRPTPMPGANIGRKTHESRSETAYLRARAFYDDGAREAAKRYCIEALAEESGHEEARALLHEIDPRAWVADEPTEPTPIPPTIVVDNPRPASGPRTGSGPRPAIGPRTDSRTGSRPVSRPGTRPSASTPPPIDPTMVITRRNDGGFDVNPTVASTRIIADEEVAPDAQTIVSTRVSTRGTATSTAAPPAWKRYIPAISAVALVVVTATVVFFVARWLLVPSTTGLKLTISKPVGGTITADGISCGSTGNQCSADFEKGKVVELQVEADRGYRFGAFTGDCELGGRTVMNSAHTCGATFTADPSTAGNPPGTKDVELLTIAPPSGGTVVGPDGILCGTQGKQCSSTRPRGSQVSLGAHADNGFTFQNFTGDCIQGGETLMLAPRLCGALFVKSGTSPSGGTVTGPTGRQRPPGPNAGLNTGGSNTGGSNTTPPGGVATSDPGRGGGPPGPGGTTTESPGTSAPPPPKPEVPGIEITPPPPPPPPTPPVEVAKKEIEELLERYRRAYEARNFEALQRAYPSVHPGVREQLRGMTAIKMAFMGPPKFVQLNWVDGKAIVELSTQQTTETAVSKRKPLDWVELFDIQKRGADNQWIIASVKKTAK